MFLPKINYLFMMDLNLTLSKNKYDNIETIYCYN